MFYTTLFRLSLADYLCKRGYTFIGDKDGFTKQSSFPIDTKQDLIDLRRDLDKTNVLTRGSLWDG
jgi:hypothetical protein